MQDSGSIAATTRSAAFFEEDWFGSFPFEEWEVAVDELIDHGDQVIAMSRQRGRGVSSGAAAELELAQICTLRGGVVVRVETYLDRKQALEAAGAVGVAMSQENVEIVRRLYEAQGTPEFLELVDPHVVWLNHASAPENKPYVGHEGLLQWYSGIRADVGDFRFDVIELIDAGGDQVVTVHRVTATGTKSGARIEQTQAAVITLLNGKIVRSQGFETKAQALEAAGLSG